MEIILSVVISVVLAFVIVRIVATQQNSRIADLEMRIKDSQHNQQEVEKILSEHLEMQKQLSKLSEMFEGTIEPIYTNLSAEIESLKSEVTKLKSAPSVDVEKLTAEIESLKSAPTVDLEKLTAEIESLKSAPTVDVEKLTAEIESLKSAPTVDLEKLTAEIESLKSAPTVDVEKLTAEIESLKSAPTVDLEKLSADIDKKITAAVNSAINTVVTGLVQQQLNAAMQKQFMPVYQKLNDLESKISTLPDIQILSKTIQTQEKTISALIERIETQEKTISTLIKRIERLENSKTPAEPPTIPPAEPEQPAEPKILKISSQQDFDNYKLKLQNLTVLKKFVAAHTGKFKWFKIDKIEAEVNKIAAPADFDNYTTEKVADNVVKIAKRFMSALDSCEREIKNPQKDSTATVELKALIEKYLQSVGIFALNFKSGDDYSDWADLGMDGEVFTVPAGERRLNNRLKNIFVQPHYLDFENEHGEQDRRIFGGTCEVYVFGA